MLPLVSAIYVMYLTQFFATTNFFSLRFIYFTYTGGYLYLYLLVLGNGSRQWDSAFIQNQNVLAPKPVGGLSWVVEPRLTTRLSIKPSAVNDKNGMSDAASSSVIQSWPWGTQITYQRN